MDRVFPKPSARIWARLVALGLIVLAVVTAGVQLKPAPRTALRPAPLAADPLRAELLRCQGLGEAGASDPTCLAAWAKSRRRFLTGGAP
ncbi:MAG: putative entry exclusion protein TrbK-alt [Pseudomonadota bacterium]|jgi:conjugative transfer region protein TrbK